MKIIFLVPDLSKLGGVSLHYKGLSKYWSEGVSYFQLKFQYYHNVLMKILGLCQSLLAFAIILVKDSPDYVVFNTSLKPGFYTQYYHFLVARFFRKKYCLFIHGWDVNLEDEYLTSSKCKKWMNNASCIFLLSKKFKESAFKNGINVPIYILTTKVDDTLLLNFNYKDKKFNNSRFLFVSRLVRGKGIYEALEVFQQVQLKRPEVTFRIVGDGEEKERVGHYIQEKHILGVQILGSLSGQDLANEYANADYFFLLTFLPEGIPAALLESMAFGLIPITRGEGGIPEIFTDDENGIMSMEENPSFYVERLLSLMEHPSKAVEISERNYKYAQEHFLASKVAKQIESIISSL